MKFKNIVLVLIVSIAIMLPLMGVLADTEPIANPADKFFVSYPGDGSFQSIFTFIISNILLPLASIVSLLFIILGGFRYITSGGDAEGAESGKKMLSNAVIGLVIIIFSWVIVNVTIQATKGQV